MKPFYDPEKLCSAFLPDAVSNITPYGNGHINDTFLCGNPPKYIIQRINTDIFCNPDALMENIVSITSFLSEKIERAGGDKYRETLTVIPTMDGKNYYRNGENCFRMYRFIDNAVSLDSVEHPTALRYEGEAFGKFQSDLRDFPAEKLHETIPDFHNTPKRVEQLKEAIDKNPAGRLCEVQKEVDFALEYSRYADRITRETAAGSIPLRVTHNDTKLNNILFDKNTGKALCVIDLDTVMLGSALFDFGDALRFGASSGSEDEKNLDKIWFDLEKFEQFARGFLSETADFLIEAEIALMPLSALIMTYECGIRFLADYINGDVYFKTHREKQNLDRARTQLKLVADIKSKLPEMSQIIKTIYEDKGALK